MGSGCVLDNKWGWHDTSEFQDVPQISGHEIDLPVLVCAVYENRGMYNYVCIALYDILIALP